MDDGADAEHADAKSVMCFLAVQLSVHAHRCMEHSRGTVQMKQLAGLADLSSLRPELCISLLSRALLCTAVDNSALLSITLH